MRLSHPFLRLVPALLALSVAVLSAGFDLDSLRSGRASFYRSPRGRGACALPGTSPWDSLYAAINKRDWRGSLACGSCLRVVGGTDSVLVRVNDRCGGCKPGGLDLSPAAFRRLAPLGRGRTDISWHFEACPESSLALSRTRGSSVHWSSLQVWGLPWPAESLLVARDTGWIPFHRARHNHFTARKVPPLPWTVRVVDVRGRERIDSLLDLAPGTTLRPDSAAVPTDSVTSAPPAADTIPPR